MAGKGKRGSRGRYKRYAAKHRRAAIRDVSKLGVGGAAEAHELPVSTLSNWVKQAAAKGSRTATGPQTERAADKEERKETSESRPRQVARRYTPSERAEVLEYVAAHGVSAGHDKFGVSRFTIYDWRRKVERAAAGQGPSPTTGPGAEAIEAQRDAEILQEWKRHPGLGPSQVRNQLRRKGIKVAVNTTRRVMEDAGYRPPKVKREPHDERFEAVRPNHLWHLDFVHKHINRASTFTLILIDDHSRFVIGHGVDDAERADLVCETFAQAVARHGKPEMVLHDKGSAFWSWRGISRFTALLTEMGIDQIPAEHKEWNGKLLDLCAAHPELDRATIAQAVYVPLGTLKDWLRGGKLALDAVDQTPTPGHDRSNDRAQTARIETLLSAWQHGDGNFSAFCDHVQQQLRIPYGRTLIASILEAYGVRLSRRLAW